MNPIKTIFAEKCPECGRRMTWHPPRDGKNGYSPGYWECKGCPVREQKFIAAHNRKLENSRLKESLGLCCPNCRVKITSRFCTKCGSPGIVPNWCERCDSQVATSFSAANVPRSQERERMSAGQVRVVGEKQNWCRSRMSCRNSKDERRICSPFFFQRNARSNCFGCDG